LSIVQEIRHVAALGGMFAELLGWIHKHLLVQAFVDQLSVAGNVPGDTRTRLMAPHQNRSNLRFAAGAEPKKLVTV
jgi:hypothetical protein